MTRPDDCICGKRYDDFRTNEDFASVRQSMFSHDPDPKTWRYRTRRMVLGAWHELKLRLFELHRQECEHYAEGSR